MSVSTVAATSTARDSAKRRVRKALWPLVVIALCTAAIWFASLLLPTGDDEDFGPSNPRPTGARALAQVLDHNGVHVSYTKDLPSGLRTAAPDTTVLVFSTAFEFEASQMQALIDSGADIVLVSPTPQMLTAADLGISHGPSVPTTGPIPADCSLPSAVAAGTIESQGTGFIADSDVATPDMTLCFTAGSAAHFVEVTRGPQTISVLADADSWSNRRIIDSGNAALALHTLGKHDTLVWFHPEDSPFVLEGEAPLLPPEFTIGLWVLVLAGVLLIISSARRFGPVVAERLPVVVKSSESTLGRGRLYRGAQAQGRAAAALRAGTASRLAQRLGVPHTSDRQALITALVNATARDSLYLEALFYGPPPTTDAELVLLGSNLSALESEIIQ